MSSNELPDYDPALKAYHTAFEPELAAAIRRFDLAPDASVLDSPCGDGFYTNLFAKHLRDGTLAAADLSQAYLDHAKHAVADVSPELDVQFVKADAYKLPFDDSSFDLVWCAQSMISLDDPPCAIREMARVLKPGGRVAVLETDDYHYVLLPWPVTLELAVQNALRERCKRKYGTGAKLAQSRKLRAEFLAAGLNPTGKTTVVADRVAPFGPSEREFLLHYFDHLREFVQPELKAGEREEFERFTSAEGDESFLNGTDAELTCLSTIHHATK